MSTSGAYLGPKLQEVPLRKKRTREVNGEQQRQCYVCEAWLSLDNFGVKSVTSGYGRRKSHQSACKKCQAKQRARLRIKSKRKDGEK